jgi:hypothetical protein
MSSFLHAIKYRLGHLHKMEAEKGRVWRKTDNDTKKGRPGEHFKKLHIIG